MSREVSFQRAHLEQTQGDVHGKQPSSTQVSVAVLAGERRASAGCRKATDTTVPQKRLETMTINPFEIHQVDLAPSSTGRNDVSESGSPATGSGTVGP